MNRRRAPLAAATAAVFAAGMSLSVLATSAQADVEESFELYGYVLDDVPDDTDDNPDWGAWAGHDDSVFVLPSRMSRMPRQTKAPKIPRLAGSLNEVVRFEGLIAVFVPPAWSPQLAA